MKTLLRLAAPAAALLAAGCAGMSAADCRGADWFRLGERDGLQYGLQPQVERYARQCARHGVEAGAADYMRGWREGYSEYQRRTSMGQPD